MVHPPSSCPELVSQERKSVVMMALEILVIGQPSGSIQCYSPKYATVRNLLPVDIDYSFETASRVTFPLRWW